MTTNTMGWRQSALVGLGSSTLLAIVATCTGFLLIQRFFVEPGSQGAHGVDFVMSLAVGVVAWAICFPGSTIAAKAAGRTAGWLAAIILSAATVAAAMIWFGSY